MPATVVDRLFNATADQQSQHCIFTGQLTRSLQPSVSEMMSKWNRDTVMVTSLVNLDKTDLKHTGYLSRCYQLALIAQWKSSCTGKLIYVSP